MKLIIDDAHIDQIKRIYDIYPVDGVTTNPSILAKSGRPPFEVLKEIRAFIGPEAQLHAQAIARTAEGMLEDAKRIVGELGDRTFVKIPAIPEGFRAMKLLRAEGIAITATAIYSPMQAYLSAKCGAAYAAPYVNRIDNLGYNGIQVTKQIQDIFTLHGFETEVLAASFKNSQQILELCQYGVGAVTAAPDVIDNLVKSPAVTAAVEDFIRDFEGLTGEGVTMVNC